MSSGARRAPAPGDRSAGWRRAAAAPEPPPPPPPGLRRTRPRSSVLAVPGRGRTRLPASGEGGDAPGPSYRSGLATPGLAGARGGEESEPSFPGPPRSAPHPRFSCVANYPLPRTLNPPRAARRAGRGSALGWGEGGVAVALRLTTTSGSAWRFLFYPWVCCSSSWLEKGKKEICLVYGPRRVRGAQRKHPRAKCRGGCEWGEPRRHRRSEERRVGKEGRSRWSP